MFGTELGLSDCFVRPHLLHYYFSKISLSHEDIKASCYVQTHLVNSQGQDSQFILKTFGQHKAHPAKNNEAIVNVFQ